MRIAYFTNRYPGGSHTFIRREIRAMEALGVSVARFALRPINLSTSVGVTEKANQSVRFPEFAAGSRKGAALNGFVDKRDTDEAKKTRFILQASFLEFFRCCLATLCSRPAEIVLAVRDAILMGWRSDSGILRHLAYVIEGIILADWCQNDGIQHIHAHFGTNSTAITMFASRLSGIPYSFTAHGSEEFIKAPLLSLQKKLEHAKFAVCVSAFGRSQLMRWTSADQWKKISVVHCGLDNSFFGPPLSLPPSAPRLVCVGRLDENKAQIVLVGAARRLRDEGTHCEIVLVGDGPMRKDVEDAIIQAGLQSTVSITGWVSDERVAEEMEAARALVLPSFTENMPVVIMEAMARGRPIISTYIGGIPELVEPGKTGWLVPAGDEASLAHAMRAALAAPISQLSEMASVGRRHILEHHNALTEAEKLKRLLERTIGETDIRHAIALPSTRIA
jgi:glycosyltransferase involved in cell wall biosynthesis